MFSLLPGTLPSAVPLPAPPLPAAAAPSGCIKVEEGRLLEPNTTSWLPGDGLAIVSPLPDAALSFQILVEECPSLAASKTLRSPRLELAKLGNPPLTFCGGKDGALGKETAESYLALNLLTCFCLLANLLFLTNLLFCLLHIPRHLR